MSVSDEKREGEVTRQWLSAHDRCGREGAGVGVGVGASHSSDRSHH